MLVGDKVNNISIIDEKGFLSAIVFIEEEVNWLLRVSVQFHRMKDLKLV